MNYRLVPRAEPEAQRPTRIDCGGTPPEPEAQRPTRMDTGGTPGTDAEREILQAAIPRAGGELKKPHYRPYTGTERGCSQMESILSFFVSIMASVVAYYICKWLDGEE